MEMTVVIFPDVYRNIKKLEDRIVLIEQEKNENNNGSVVRHHNLAFATYPPPPPPPLTAPFVATARVNSNVLILLITLQTYKKKRLRFKVQ